MSSNFTSSYLAVAELEKHHLPDGAIFIEAARVKHHFKKIREKAVRRSRLAAVTALADWYEAEEMSPLPDYLCFARYGLRQSDGQILSSLEARPFTAASVSRLLDLCWEHPEREFSQDIVFLGTPRPLKRVGYTAYPALKRAPDGAHIFGSALNRGKFKPGCWLVALQPTGEETAEILEQIIQAEEVMKERLVG